jgi:hypothetical protein
MRLITDAKESANAFDALRRSFESDSIIYDNYPIGWPSGSGKFRVCWRETDGIWGLFEPRTPHGKRRFWICFGIGHPEETKASNITVEINPPNEGINRRVGGAFLADSAGATFIGHTGRVGGNRRGIRPSSFKSLYSGGHKPIYVSERAAELFVFGPLSSTDWPQNLATYVKSIAEFKARSAPVRCST